MSEILYKTYGTCSRAIKVMLDGETIKSVEFMGGCGGNTTGIAKLVEGMPAKEAINRLSGIRCGFKETSCPDQLARALMQMLEEKE